MKRLFTRIFGRRLASTLERAEGGIFKRIDENRELANLLASQAPMLVQENPQILNSMKALDRFMVEIAKQGFSVYREDRCLFKPRKGMPRECAFQPQRAQAGRGRQ